MTSSSPTGRLPNDYSCPFVFDWIANNNTKMRWSAWSNSAIDSHDRQATSEGKQTRCLRIVTIALSATNVNECAILAVTFIGVYCIWTWTRKLKVSQLGISRLSGGLFDESFEQGMEKRKTMQDSNKSRSYRGCKQVSARDTVLKGVMKQLNAGLLIWVAVKSQDWFSTSLKNSRKEDS